MTVYPRYEPTPLVAGDLKLVDRPVVVAAGQNLAGTVLPRGTVLGKRTTDTVATGPKASGANTGNGTVAMDGSTPILSNARAGTYQVRFTSPTAFRVTDPRGTVLGDGAVGTAFADQIKFNVTAGATAFAAGDGFDIAVSGTGKMVLSKAGATDGSQDPVCITADDVDTSAADAFGPAYYTGEFAFEIANVDPSWTLDTLNAAFAAKGTQIYFRSVGAVA
jgi:hypothetical protein